MINASFHRNRIEQSMDPELIDRIYESALVPELWPGVLDELGHIAEATGGLLFIIKADIQSWTSSSSASAREATARFVNEGWFGRGHFFARCFAACHAGFLVDEDIFTAAEQDQEPIYRDFWRPIGFGRCTGTVVPLPTGEKIALGLFRKYERGPFEPASARKLDELRPHLARSALMSARLQLERARIASETLAALGPPALVLSEQGKVLAANSLIESLTGYVQWQAFDRVSLKDRAADNLLRDAMAAIDAARGSVRSFPVRDAGAEAMMVVHVIPIRLSARDIFVRCAAALVLTPVTLPQAPPVELVQSLFDLTPAEARVARSLASGKTVEDIASAGGVSRSTILTQLGHVMEKTGCHRQADVVALLTAISPARLTHPI
jgi:DNA-binding CsgD family transcriptional regulator